ncbi:MAG: hypothetical protein LAO78_05460 [Acidobacteriia bacterium]|nr:hypothetical protein [Terriglobia bacterium]
MPELPDLLRQRLAAAENDTRMHPDADTITAFVEQSLPAAERQTVVAHLSVCEPCREVVSLSQTSLAELETQTVLKPAPVSRWRRLLTPGFSVAAAVAAMAVIAVLVLQLPQKSTPPSAQGTQQAKVTTPADQNISADKKTSTEAKTSVPVQQPTETRSAQSAPLLDRDEPARETQAKETQAKEGQFKEAQAHARRDQPADVKALAGLAASAPAAKAPVLTASLKKDYVNTNFFAANSNEFASVDGQADKDVPSAPQPQPSSANSSFISAKNKLPAFADIPSNTAAKPDIRLLTPTPPHQRFDCPVCKIVTAGAHSLRLRSITPAIRSGAVSDSAMGAPGMFSSALQKNQPSEVAAAPEKAEGGSLASSDALSHGALATSNFKARESSATLWKVAGGKLIKSSIPSQWEDAYPVAGFQFSFVNARGNDVWAGGSSAFLIHSRDGGSSWEIVKLGDAATGTIVNILAGALNIQVKTSDNQLWSSTDGGKTWTMQSE